MIFVLDTNVLWETNGIRRLSRAIRANGFRLQVPALVHAERIAQARRKHGDKFDMSVIHSFIETHNIEVVPFDRGAAEQYAERVATRYPDDEAWHVAKRNRCAQRFQVSAAAGAACPATVDWFIAHGHPGGDVGERVVFVTNDRGSEHVDTGSLRLTDAIVLAEATMTLPEKDGSMNSTASVNSDVDRDGEAT